VANNGEKLNPFHATTTATNAADEHSSSEHSSSLVVDPKSDLRAKAIAFLKEKLPPDKFNEEETGESLLSSNSNIFDTSVFDDRKHILDEHLPEFFYQQWGEIVAEMETECLQRFFEFRNFIVAKGLSEATAVENFIIVESIWPQALVEAVTEELAAEFGIPRGGAGSGDRYGLIIHD